MKRTSCLIIGYGKYLCYLCLLLGFTACSQYKNVEIPMADGWYPYSGCEPSIDMDPSNTDHLVAGSILNGYHYSLDGGRNWTSKALKSSFGVYGDPVLKFNSKGNVFYFHLASYPKTSHLDRIVCQRSETIDGKFNDGTAPAPNGTKVQDKHWMVIDPETDVIYMTWTQFDAYDSSNPKDSSIILFSKSKDDGNTWTSPKRISKFGGDCLDSDDTVEGAMPALGSNGELFVVWSGPRGLMMQVSTDRGESWLDEELKLFDHVGGWNIDVPDFYRANGLPVFVSDYSKTSPNYGNLYLNWTIQDERTGRTAVMFSKSTDNGKSWSKPTMVHDNDLEFHHFLTWLCVDPITGFLHVVYYKKGMDSKETDVAWSFSKDGGSSFAEKVISKTSFKPSENVFFGDYLNIVAINNIIRPVWPRMDDGKISLWTALIEVK